MRLENKVAVVTGAGAGFGEGIARRFAAEGAKVVVSDIHKRDGEKVAAAITQDGGTAMFVEADVTNGNQMAALVEHTQGRFGALDIMVNNAGMPQVNGAMEQVEEATFDKIFDVNVKSVYWNAIHVVPAMRAQGSGVILNTSSTAAIRPRPGLVFYNASKAALSNLTKGMAVELAPSNIRVNALCPVAGDTQMLPQFLGGQITPKMKEQFISTIPLGRFSTPEDIANAALYLASDEAAFITGVCLEIDGGRCV